MSQDLGGMALPGDAAGMSRSWNNDQPIGLAGIGLLMQQDNGPDNKVFIKSVVAGGACDRDGQIAVGDYVLAVDGENVVGFPVADIRERIVGPIGSVVRVVFERQATGEAYERSLTRGNSAPAPASDAGGYAQMSRSMDARALGASFSVVPLGATTNDSEVSRMKSKIAELEAQLSISQEQLRRTKGLLEHDRNASIRSVKEIDALQRKNTEQVMELQALLNRSEQARRELEIQVANSKSREEEFHLAFNRAKEQTEAREQYFADLKKQFDEMRVAWDRDMAALRDAKGEVEKAKVKSDEEGAKLRRDIQELKNKEIARREREEGVRQLMHEAETKLLEAKTLEEKVRGQAQALHLLFGQWHKDFFTNKSKEEAELEQYFLA